MITAFAECTASKCQHVLITLNRSVVSHTNALGGNISLIDDNRKILVRYEYDVFGAIRSETGTSDNSRKFTGKEYDSDVRLYYYAEN